MPTSPKVSIIVPIYNARPWLGECVESVLCQSENSWQLILVDDGSTDESPRMCDDYARSDERITVCHKPNGGLSSARNHGLKYVDGEFILFLDADDRLHLDAVKFLLNLQQRTDSEICIGGAIYTDHYEFGELDFTNHNTFSPNEIIEKILYQRGGFINSMCNILIRRDLFNELRFTEGTWYEDLDFFYRLFLKATSICHSKEITYFYRANPSSFINTWSSSRLDVLGVVDRLNQFMEKNGTSALIRAARDRRFSAYYNIFVLAAKNGERDICGRCWPVISSQRVSEIINPNVRLKNKLGALLSLLGQSITRAIASRL